MTPEYSHVLFIGGRAGTGKTSLASAFHELLSNREIQHAFIEGDYLDMAYPPPWEHRLAEKNLALLWANYRTLGYRRLIYTNVMSVVEIPALTEAMGDHPEVTAVLLDVADETMKERLQQRESETSFIAHLKRNQERRKYLEETAPAWVHRLSSDGKSLDELARSLGALTGWLPSS